MFVRTSTLATVPEIKVETGNHGALQMPLLMDPAKADDTYIPGETLDFSVRLGSSLSRGHEIDERQVRKNLNLSLNLPNTNGGPVNGSPKAILSPRSPKDSSPRFGAKISRSRRESRRGSTASRSISIESINVDNETARVKLQRVWRMVRIISGVCLELKRYVRACETKTWSFMEMYLHVKEDLNQVVAFNPHNYSRTEPERYKLKKLLAKPGQERTASDVKVILALMRGNTSFQDYPIHIQMQLAKCMEYQGYEARRVILKQGHRPEAFYILLAGQVIANIADKSPETGKQFVKTVKDMGPGDTFGELALIEGGRRTASIVCKTNVELLVILKDDFDSIIRSPLVHQIDDHVDFFRTMSLFRDFPCDEFAHNPSQFFYHYFKKGDVVVRNSNESKYIIAIKAGKCTVICTYNELHKTRSKPQSAAQKKQTDAAFPNYDAMKKIAAFNRKPKSDADKLKDSICLGLLTGNIDRTRLADHGPDVQRPKTSMTQAEVDKRKQPPPLKKSKTLTSFYETISQDRKDAISTDDELQSDVHGSFWALRLRHSTKRKGTAASAFRQSASSRCTSSRSTRSTRTRGSNPFYTTERQTCAQIAELQTGMVFGLESLVQKPSTTLSLVSQGAECIFISKRLFLNLANIKVLRVVTDMVQTYPSQEFIEEQVRNYRNWQKYKSGLVHGVLNKHK